MTDDNELTARLTAELKAASDTYIVARQAWDKAKRNGPEPVQGPFTPEGGVAYQADDALRLVERFIEKGRELHEITEWKPEYDPSLKLPDDEDEANDLLCGLDDDV